MKKSVHWFFHSYALVDQDIPLCSMITPTVPDQCRMEVRQGKREHAHSSFPRSRCSWVFFFFFRLCSPRLAQKPWCLAPAVTGCCIHPHIQNSTSRHKGRDSDAVSKGTPSSCSFCAFSQQLGQLRQHPYKLLSIFRSVSPSGRQKPHSYSNECSYNAMTVNT